jgi:hypothetical protein
VIIVVKQSQHYLMIVVEDQNCGLVLQEEHTHPGNCLPLLLSFRSFFLLQVLQDVDEQYTGSLVNPLSLSA